MEVLKKTGSGTTLLPSTVLSCKKGKCWEFDARGPAHEQRQKAKKTQCTAVKHRHHHKTVINVRRPSTSIGPSIDCTWVLNEVSLTPWCCMVDQFEVKIRRFSTCFEGIHHCVKEASPTGGHSSSTKIGPSNDCKWVFKEASLMPWCHAVEHFEVKKNEPV